MVQISDQSSKLTDLCFGVPQGSILSPVLFLIYVNDIEISLQRGKVIQYADDTTLCFSDTSCLLLEQQVFSELNECIQAFHNINLKTNKSKSNFINFALGPIDSQWRPSVLLEDTFLEEAYTSKFLGIHLDRGLTWNSHIDAVCAKLTSGIFVLRSLSKYCPIQILMMAYYGLIFPHLIYGIVLWGACANSQFMRVFRLQKKAIRIIAKGDFRASCRPLFKNLKILPLPCLYILETTMFCFFKRSLIRGRDIHEHNTRGRDNYRTGRHRTVIYEHLPSEAGVHFINSLPNSIKSATTPKAFKNRLKDFLSSHAFYNVGEFLADDWETIQAAY